MTVATLTEDRIELLLHRWGGDHTGLGVPRNRTGQHRHGSDAGVRELIGALARQQDGGAIAATLNRLGRRTGRDNPRTEARVRSFRSHHHVPHCRPGETAERREGTLQEASRRLGVGEMTVLRLIRNGTIGARQVCQSAPRAIPEAQFAALRPAAARVRSPRAADPAQTGPERR